MFSPLPPQPGVSVRPGTSMRRMDAPFPRGILQGRLKCKLRKLTEVAQGPVKGGLPEPRGAPHGVKVRSCRVRPLQFPLPGLSRWKLGSVTEELPARFCFFFSMAPQTYGVFQRPLKPRLRRILGLACSSNQSPARVLHSPSPISLTSPSRPCTGSLGAGLRREFGVPHPSTTALLL